MAVLSKCIKKIKNLLHIYELPYIKYLSFNSIILHINPFYNGEYTHHQFKSAILFIILQYDHNLNY